MKVTGEPDTPALDAVRVFTPAVWPNVQLPTVAMPLASVTVVPPDTEPPPDVTANVTVAPLTGLLLASLITTLGLLPLTVFTVADCDTRLPGATAIVAVPVPATAVAENVTEVRPGLVATMVFAPMAVPSVQPPDVAMPLAFVVVGKVAGEPVAPAIAPPPDATANVTDTPPLGLPFLSFTITLGGVATAVPAAACKPFPEFTAIWAATSAADVTLNDVV